MNGQSVEGESHAKVIELIKSNPTKLRMVLMSVPPKENERLDGEAVSYCSEEDFDIKRIDITIPSISQKEENGSKYVAYNVYLNGKFLCSHRYKAFYNLQSDLKNKFYQFEFPKFPGKWPFQLSPSQLEKRHKELEQWLIQVSSVTQLWDHFYIQDFLGLTKNSTFTNDSIASEPDNVDIKISLMDKTIISVNIPTESDSKTLNDAVCTKLDIPNEYCDHFAVYKLEDDNKFEVPLSSQEKPADLYVQSYNESKALHFTFRKFVFSTAIEEEMSEDPAVLNLLYKEGLDALNGNLLDTTGKEIELKRTQHVTTQKEFLKIAQTCSGYNTVIFPHCMCDSRKDGHVILSINVNKITIQACSTQGEKQDQIKNFSWANVSDYGVEGDLFHFTISKNNSERKISVKTRFTDYMDQCFTKITQESKQHEA